MWITNTVSQHGPGALMANFDVEAVEASNVINDPKCNKGPKCNNFGLKCNKGSNYMCNMF